MEAEQATQGHSKLAETERVRRFWEGEAPTYDRSMGFWDKVVFRGDRAWACGQASGEVLEIAVGTGLNIPYYPDGVRLTAIDISETMLERARRRAKEIGRDVDLRKGDAQALAFPDAHFDTVVCTFSLCSIPDHRRAIAEMGRVLRPGGRVLFVEHVRSPNLLIRGIEHILELTSRGDHYLREPLDGLRAEGFVVDTLERKVAGFVERVSGRKPSDSPIA
jgi:ubiquinone/menaquinone biosynthesis C-methylase UbiE